jgi:hypothetical protein
VDPWVRKLQRLLATSGFRPSDDDFDANMHHNNQVMQWQRNRSEERCMEVRE